MAELIIKEMKVSVNLEEVIMKNTLQLPQPLVNEVVAVGTEIRMKNIWNGNLGILVSSL